MPWYGFFDEDREASKKERYYGPDHDDWERKIKKVCPWQFWFREEVLYNLERYCNFITFYPTEEMDLDPKKWTLKQRFSAISWDYENYIVKAIRNWKIVQINDRLKPFNRVHIKSLPRTYCDTSELMLHSQMQLLCDFLDRNPRMPDDYPVEFQVGNDGEKYDINLYWRNWAVEAWAIRNWWETREKRQSDLNDKTDALYKAKKDKTISKDEWYEQTTKLENEFEEQTTEMLCRLAKIRKGFWD